MPSLSEGANAYGLGGTHRHLGEFDQEFSRVAGRPVEVQFTPHLIPMPTAAFWPPSM
jgi:N-acetyl-gamma-glutamyl-phosphate reductase